MDVWYVYMESETEIKYQNSLSFRVSIDKLKKAPNSNSKYLNYCNLGKAHPRAGDWREHCSKAYLLCRQLTWLTNPFLVDR
jgi:hypothetical protein